uniref:Secreted protein n=1 Tax=Panagrellus redivivus TaxID=6233 RepID=A0A7E4ZWA4_PANRE
MPSSTSTAWNKLVCITRLSLKSAREISKMRFPEVIRILAKPTTISSPASSPFSSNTAALTSQLTCATWKSMEPSQLCHNAKIRFKSAPRRRVF